MPVTKFSLFNGYCRERFPEIDAQECVNMYPSINTADQSKHFLAPSPGYAVFPSSALTVGNAIRVLYAYDDTKLFAFSSTNAVFFDKDFNETVIAGNLLTQNGHIEITNNVSQLFLTDGAAGYIINKSTNALTEITAAGFPPNPTGATFLDGFFITSSGGTNQFYLSSIDDGTMWDATQFAMLESAPDIIVMVKVVNRRLFVFGQKVTEVWYNAGAPIFPFKRDNNLILTYGCKSPSSITEGFGILMWVGIAIEGAPVVLMSNGNQPQVISTPPIEYLLQNFEDITACDAFMYQMNGHIFYQISFSQDNLTLVYDLNTQLWHTKETELGDRVAINCHWYFNNQHIVGHYQQSKLMRLQDGVYEYDGTTIPRRVVSGHLSFPGLPQFKIKRVQLECVQGVGNYNPIDPNYTADEFPSVYMEVSRDRGKTWGNKLQAGLGAASEFLTRTIWRMLGISRYLTLRFTFYNFTEFTITGANITFEVKNK